MKALILGAGGQVGQALERAAPAGAELAPLRRQDCDIGEASQVAGAIDRLRPDVVFNAAAYTAVDLAESQEDAATVINGSAPGMIAQCARRRGARFIHVSTDFVFDGKASRPYRTDDPTNPLSAYGRSKRLGEVEVLAADPDALIVRTAWVYSAGGRNFVATMLRLMTEQGSVRVVDDQVGTPTSAESLARALWQLVLGGASGIHHFTDAGVASWYDFGVAVSEEAFALGLLGAPADVVPVSTTAFPTKAERPSFSVLDKSQTWPRLSDPPQHWRVGLRNVLEEVKEIG
ncbi:dTDP-4-dehydrorhamnose reductase [Sphingosinicella humi]|uniref:dTDP-4-dehydrorhamnose reductase n=1 Tax=Allosphingosinicella humi TaxID=2068657 RepID=A0A2U2J542_9SPHN|nr:dTDP-4-dehydrorhamnose reductase [Sphingosinicella humi]PWG03448.1 dTDP-4-dehydrorhamnose reductase [Sphingosinicella humi]